DQISRSQLTDLMDNLSKNDSTSKSSTPPAKPSPVPPLTPIDLILTSRANREKNESPLLTPTVLGRTIAPFLNAIISIQNVFNEVKGLPLRKMAILEIRSQPELVIRLSGEVSEAVFVIKGIVNTWRQRNDDQINRYSTGNLTNRIEKTTLERSKVEMASQMLELVKAGLPEKEKFGYLSMLIPSIDILIYSEFEIK
ncbi:MAG TPA: hypothetical protein PK530_25075, partial [Anaerolineales bacterium]|nr:hypothetical protein [Anaerolineales bacterium]